MIFNFIDTCTLVTGVSSGIGLELAKSLLKLGGEVFGIDKNDNCPTDLEKDLKNGNFKYRNVDLSDSSNIEYFFKNCYGKFKLDNLVCCAGLPYLMPLKGIDFESVSKINKINGESNVILLHYFSKKIFSNNRQRSVVFISSVMANHGDNCSTVYSMSKASIHGLTKSSAIELARENIRVNCIAPGYVNTPMFEKVGRNLSSLAYEDIKKRHVLGLGSPSDISNTIVFLLSKYSKWTTGSIFTVDGGFSAW